MMTIIYNFYDNSFNIFDLNQDSHTNNHIFIIFLKIFVHGSIYIYHHILLFLK